MTPLDRPQNAARVAFRTHTAHGEWPERLAEALERLLDTTYRDEVERDARELLADYRARSVKGPT